MMPPAQMPVNRASSRGFTALRSMTREGNERVVTAIMKDSTVPSCAPLASRASAMGMVPKISAYMGIPTRVARITPRGLSLPSTAAMRSSGIQLWMMAPMPTPTRM